jgi:two-component system chemotaxis response regulator CheY
MKLKSDVVTMDITMPIMEGVEAVKHIKEFDQEAKIIMCSAMGEQGRILENGTIT